MLSSDTSLNVPTRGESMAAQLSGVGISSQWVVWCTVVRKLRIQLFVDNSVAVAKQLCESLIEA